MGEVGIRFLTLRGLNSDGRETIDPGFWRDRNLGRSWELKNKAAAISIFKKNSTHNNIVVGIIN